MSPREIDEDDVRIRPGRFKSRPRSKDRPAHPSVHSGFVVAVDRGRFTIDVGEDRQVYAVKARELGRKGLVVGDRVDLAGDMVPGAGVEQLARVVRRHERSSVLRRSADDADAADRGDHVERVIVANATALAVVTATTNPEPRTGLIDRALVAAYDAGIEPMLVVTKTDLAPADDLLARYAPLGLTSFTISGKQVPDALVEALTDGVTVLLGHSGVGKSTLVNSLVPNADRATGGVNEVTGRGRHTSTSVVALALPAGGWIIDTPGVRSFGLAHVEAERVVDAFPDLHALAENCPRGCTHDEPECCLDDATDPALVDRVRSLRRLLRSRASAGY